MQSEVYVGSYGSGSSGGLYPLIFDAPNWRCGPPDQAIKNASYAAYNELHDLHALVEEHCPGFVAFYRRESGRGFGLLGRTPTGGKAPCFVEIGPNHDVMAVANYESGSVAFYALDASGLAAAPVRVFQNSGGGPDPKRQAGPHAHCAGFAWGYAHLVDLGADVVLRFPLIGAPKFIGEPLVAFRTPSGEGPRHVLFHPKRPTAYLLTELGNKVFVLAPSDSGKLKEVQRLSTLPADFSGEGSAAHLALNERGDLLYVSNRGHDSIAVFSVLADGSLRHRQTSPTFGASPRHFLLLEDMRQVLVAHEKDGGVTVISLGTDGIPGELIQRLEVPRACFLMRPRYSPM